MTDTGLAISGSDLVPQLKDLVKEKVDEQVCCRPQDKGFNPDLP